MTEITMTKGDGKVQKVEKAEFIYWSADGRERLTLRITMDDGTVDNIRLR